MGGSKDHGVRSPASSDRSERTTDRPAGRSSSLLDGLGNRGLLALLHAHRGARGASMPASSDADEGAADRAADVTVQHLAARGGAGASTRAQPAQAEPGRLDPALRSVLEAQHAVDLGDVRLHTEPGDAVLARALQANALTHGVDIHFGAGRYRPETERGQRLVAHEVAHVVQQKSGGPRVQRDHDDDAPETTDELVDEDAAAAPEAPFTHSISAADPSVVFVPASATRERIARELSTTIADFVPVGAAEARPPSEDVRGIRFYHPTAIPAALMSEMRTSFEARLDRDVQSTVDALVAQSGGWSAAQWVIGWARYSDYRDASGRSYTDRFFDALDARTIRTTTDYLITSTTSSRSALEELLAVTSGDVNAAVRRTRARSSRATEDDRRLAAEGEIPAGHVVGRWISGQDTAAVAAQVAQLLGTYQGREEAEIRARSSPFQGSRVMIFTGGFWRIYGIYFDTSASGSILPPVVGGDAENGRFLWYYPSTVYFHAGEFDPVGPADQPSNREIQRDVLAGALASTDPRAIVGLDYGVLRSATVAERVDIFRRVIDAGFSNLDTRGYTTTAAVAVLTRTIMALPPEEFAELERALDRAGLTARLMAIRDARLAPLGTAFTYQTIASQPLGANAFGDPTVLSHGSASVGGDLDYFLARTSSATSHVVPRSEWAAGTSITARDAAPVEPGLPGEAAHDIARTTVTFEHGASPTGWGDTPAWSRRSSSRTRAFLPTELVTLESVSPVGRHRRIASAFEAALSQGDPESEVGRESAADFFNTLLLVQGAFGVARLGSIGVRALGATSLRAALRFAAAELSTQAGRTAVRSVVDLALFTAARQAQAHQEELERTPEGRAFLASLTAAIVLLTARDVGRLIESGAVEQVIATGRAALALASDVARVAVRRTLQNFRALRFAWQDLEARGLVAVTDVGGFTVRRPSSLADFSASFRVGQARAAGEDLLTAIGTGTPEAERARSVLSRLEEAAGGLERRPAGGTPRTTAEQQAGLAYRDVARHAATLPEAARAEFLASVDRVLSLPGRAAGEVAPFLRGALAFGRNGGDVAAYLRGVEWLANESGLSRAAFQRLANNAAGRSPVDMVWLRSRAGSLSLADLEELAANPKTPWATYAAASRVGSAPTEAELSVLLRAQRDARGAAAEMVARDRASQLAEGYRVSGRHVPMGEAEIDIGLTSTEGLGRSRALEVKGWTRDRWTTVLDEYEAGPQSEAMGARMIRKMMSQLEQAGTATARGEAPLLAVTDAMRAEDVARLRTLLASRRVRAQIVFLPEGEITAASGRLGRGLGFRQ